MAKVLLLNPLIEDKRVCSLTPPLGLGYLANMLRKEKIKVEILCGAKNNITIKEIISYVKKKDFNFIGLQVFSFAVNSVKKQINYLKETFPEKIIIIGGAHPSSAPLEAMEVLKADYAFKGEAEYSLLKLIKAITTNKKNFSDIPNLVWRKNGNIIINPQNFILDLDKVDFPAWDLMDPNEYPPAPNGGFVKNLPVAIMITTRGCPYSCTFCGCYNIVGKKIRKRSIGNIIQEMKILKNKFKIKEIHIMDDNFTFDKSFAQAVCENIIKEKLNLSFAIPNGVRLDKLDKELLKVMEKAGFYSLAVGIESCSPRILKHMKKNITLKTIKEKTKLISQNTNIRITGFFILGYPEDTIQDIKTTIYTARKLNIQRAFFSSFTPLPGTEIYENLKNKKYKANFGLFHSVSYIPNHIPPKVFKFLRLYGYFIFYFRPKILIGLLREIRSFHHLKYILRRIRQLFI